MKDFILLHIMLLIYSTTGIFSKIAAGQIWWSVPFMLCCAGVIGVLIIYAIGWQQVMKHLPLSVAFANKPVVIIWGMIWGKTIFGEYITVMNIIGVFLIILGIEVYSHRERSKKHE